MRHLTRLHQLLLILAILSGCYAPDVRDCTVTCSAATDCASGQVCGKDGFCAAEGVAGTCGPGGVDAGVDAAPRVMLHVTVDGTGKVDVVGAGMCGGGGGGSNDCMISVPRGPVVINAIVTQTDKPFERWTTPNCTGQTSSCMFTANTATTVGAKFK
ncbi:hypothetical protein BH11MYX3_BH11MYX3_46260 [soil metagenome]